MAEPKAYKGKLADFKPDQHNLNRHKQRGRGMVETSQRKRGFGRPGFAAKDKTMLGGNLSILEVAADIELGNGEIFVVETDGDIPIVHVRRDLDPDTEAAKLLAAEDNKSALESIDFDPEMFAAEIAAGIDFGGIFTADEQAALLAGLNDEPPEDTGPQIDRAEELRGKWGVELGQLWALGEHRLICGDCTDRAVVEKVMGGELADLWLTDPPYGVSYADKNAFLNTFAKGNAVQKRIENDHASMDEMKELWRNASLLAYEFTTNQAAYYWFACQGGDQMMMMMMIGDAGWKVRHELIWLKNNHVLGRSDYQYKHEPILYGWKRDGTHKWFGGFQTSVLEFDKPQKSGLHPTTKPVELIEYLVGNSTKSNDLIYDPFLGSGTTLIAAQNLNRRCRGIELDPGYCAVILERFQSTFGIEPELVNNAYLES